MDKDFKLPGSMKISGDSMQIVERGLKRLAEIDDATNATGSVADAANGDAAFAVTARAVAREITLIANRVKSHPVGYINLLRKYIGEEAALAITPKAYGAETQWHALAAKLILPGIDRALLRAA